MEYWTIIDDRHAGPFTAEELAQRGLSPETPVWHSGLPDWVEAREIPELRSLMEQPEAPEAPVAPETPAAPVQEAPQQPEPQPQMQQPIQQPIQPMPQPVQPQWEWQQQVVPCSEPCPATYLVWSIIVTVLCCMPFGIAAIIFSAQVKSAYNRGNLSKAEKMSEYAQWCIILSIVLGLLWMPVQLAFSGLF